MSSPQKETDKESTAESASGPANAASISGLLSGQGNGDISQQLLLLQHKQALLQQQRQQQEQISALDKLLAQNQQPNAARLQQLLMQQQQQQQHIQLASLLASGAQGRPGIASQQKQAETSTNVRPVPAAAEKKTDDASVEDQGRADAKGVDESTKKMPDARGNEAENGTDGTSAATIHAGADMASGVRGSSTEDLENDTFPFKLFRMLAKVEEEGKEDVISFTNNDRAFIIHKSHRFTNEIMPEYFTTTRMSSFQRQLNLYGFRRITEGPNKGAYYHEFFQKGNLALCNRIKRKKNTTKPPPNFFGAFPGGLAVGGLNGGPAFSVRQMLADPSALLNLQSLGMAGLPGLSAPNMNLLAASQPNGNLAALLALQQQKEQVEALQQLLLNQQRKQR